MDNVRFHHAADEKNKLSALQINHDYLPPYSSHLNPIEEFFSMLKSKLCSLKTETPAITIEDVLTTVCNENLYVSQCRGFFNSMGRW